VDPALRAGDVLFDDEIRSETAQPVVFGDDIVVEERNPRRVGGPPAQVSRSCRSSTWAGQELNTRRKFLATKPAVGNDDDLSRLRPGERDQPLHEDTEARPSRRRDDHVERGSHAMCRRSVKSVRRTR
jgi:hypothetical protein